MKKYITVVYEVSDSDSFREEFNRIHQKMLVEDTEPWRVTGVSLDDEMHRLEMIESALDLDDGKEIVFQILGQANCYEHKLDDFCS